MYVDLNDRLFKKDIRLISYLNLNLGRFQIKFQMKLNKDCFILLVISLLF